KSVEAVLEPRRSGVSSAPEVGSEAGERGQAPKPPLRLIVHRTELIDGAGQAGAVLEAERDRLGVAAGQGAVRLLEGQVPGKNPGSAAEFLRGHRVLPGDMMVMAAAPPNG